MPAYEDLDYRVEEWAADWSRPIEVIARCAILSVAAAAYGAACLARPTGAIMLAQKARIVRQRAAGTVKPE